MNVEDQVKNNDKLHLICFILDVCIYGIIYVNDCIYGKKLLEAVSESKYYFVLIGKFLCILHRVSLDMVLGFLKHVHGILQVF